MAETKQEILHSPQPLHRSGTNDKSARIAFLEQLSRQTSQGCP